MQSSCQPAGQLSDAETLQRGSLHTCVACTATDPAPADTRKRSSFCSEVTNFFCQILKNFTQRVLA